MTLRERLFRGMNGCTNHDCIVKERTGGMATNGSCHCLMNLSRSQLHILKCRLSTVIDKEV